MRNGFWLRDQRGNESSLFPSFVRDLDYGCEDGEEDDKNKNAFNSAKRGMKAFDEFRPALAGRTGLILPFAEKCPETWGRRAQPNRYPDFGLKPYSRLPGLSSSGTGSL